MRVEQVILKQLINNEEYTRNVIPFLFKDYFADTNEQIVFEKIKEFINNYNKIPTKEALVVELDNDKTLNDDQFQHCGKIVNELVVEESPDLQWLIDKTEKFCQELLVIVYSSSTSSNSQSKTRAPCFRHVLKILVSLL